MKQFSILLFLTLLMSMSVGELKAQNRDVVQFSGIIKDISTGQPIPFATVYVDKIYRGTITNLEGFFSWCRVKMLNTEL